jgi:hypothetical protein
MQSEKYSSSVAKLVLKAHGAYDTLVDLPKTPIAAFGRGCPDLDRIFRQTVARRIDAIDADISMTDTGE